jgi:hypothetical protein
MANGFEISIFCWFACIVDVHATLALRACNYLSRCIAISSLALNLLSSPFLTFTALLGSLEFKPLSERLRPRTIHQLLHGPSTSSQPGPVESSQVRLFLLSVRDSDPAKVKLIVKVLAVDESFLSTCLSTTDYTGMLDVVVWHDPGDTCSHLSWLKFVLFCDYDTSIMIDNRTGQYVRVVGSIRRVGSRSSLHAESVVGLESHNEITHHLLEVILDSLHEGSNTAIRASSDGAC